MERPVFNRLAIVSLLSCIAVVIAGWFDVTATRGGLRRFAVEINRNQIIVETCARAATPPRSNPLLSPPNTGPIRSTNETDAHFADPPGWRVGRDGPDRPSLRLAGFGEVNPKLGPPRFYSSAYFAGTNAHRQAWIIERFYFWTAPVWIPLVLFSILPLVWLRRWVRRKFPAAATIGLCPICGYDLRASPHRCPECGNMVTARGATTIMSPKRF
jgi:hypothetical protein